MAESGVKAVLGPVVEINEERIHAHLDEVVRATVEETLNALLDAEADQLCGVWKYERAEGRKDTRADSYDRKLHTKAGEATLTMPKLRTLTSVESYLLNQLVADKPSRNAHLPTLSSYLTKHAQLGGYLARAKESPPEKTVIWRGLARLTDIQRGFILGTQPVGN